MKYMLIMRATDEGFAAFANVDFTEILEAMGRFNDEMISAGVLVAAEGLDDAADGVVIDFSSTPPVVTDGPYGETKELFGGFWILDVASKEEAVEWAKRAPDDRPGPQDRDPPRHQHRGVPAGQPVDPEGARVARGHGPALSRPGQGRDAVEAVWRIESARIVATLARYTGDFALAEDLAQEALAEALVTWPRDGVPPSPPAGCSRSARRRAVDAYRRRATLDEKYATLARDLTRARADDLPWDPDRIDDDVLALMFISCHPVLSRESQVALTLRVVGGLTSDRGRARVPRADRDGPGPDHARQEDPRRGAGAVRGAAARGPPRAARLGAERALPDLHGGLVGHVGQRTGSGRTWPTRRSG